MAKLVAIPTGTQRRRGSDGSGFAVGKQTASGTPLDRVNYESVAGTAEIGSGFTSGETVRFYLDEVILTGMTEPVKSDGGYGPITIEITGTTTADADFVVTGRDADGNVITEEITLTASADPSATGSTSFAGIYLITIEAPTLAPTTATWSAEVDTVANEVTNGMIPVLFPVSNLDMNEQANVEASDLISSVGAATPPVIGQYSGQCNFTTGLLVEELAYLFDGIFNNPTSSEEVEAQDADGGTAIDVVSGTDQAITLTIPDNSALTPAQADGTLHPSKLKITFGTLAVPEEAGQAGSFTVTGFTKIGAKQNNRRRRTETISVAATDMAVETENYYVYDADNDLTVESSFVTEPIPNARFTLDPELHEIVFTIAQNDVIFDGWSVQGLVGGEPRAGYDVVPSQITVNATPTGVSFEMQCPAGQVTRKRTIQGGEIEEPFLDANYKQAETLRYGGWAGAFKYAGDIVKMTNLAIVFNRNYAADDAVDADRFATDIEASDDRAVTVSPTTRFTSSYEKDASVNNWQDIFRDETRTALEARWYHYSRYGQRRQNIFKFPSALIVESPQTTASGGASIDEPLSLQAFATDAEREFTLTMFTTKEYSV